MTPAAQQPGTARLEYESIQQHHAAGLQHALCDPRVYEFIDAPCPTPADLEVSFLRKAAGAPAHRPGERWVNYAVRQRTTGQLIGRLEATVIAHRSEVAYLLGPEHWGQGYATEGLRWLHETLAASFAVTEFWATVAPDNQRSQRLLERAGYTPAAPDTWPHLTSYAPGDRVYRCLGKRLTQQPAPPPKGR